MTKTSSWDSRAMVALVITIFTAASANAASVDKSNPSHKEALSIAKTVDIFVRATRAKYTKKAVGKLKKDGTGAALDSGSKSGYIPLPAQFIRDVAFETVMLQKKSKDEKFAFFLRSRWNLNPEQGLKDDFEKAGWKFLEDQQKGALASGKSLKNISWKPYTSIETGGGQKTLRYLSADTGSALPCVTCHNNWEKKASVKEMRKKGGVEEGKVFRMNELMGAVSISVPLQ